MAGLWRIDDRRDGRDRRETGPDPFEGAERRAVEDRRMGPADRRAGRPDRRTMTSEYWVGPNDRRGDSGDRRRLWREF